MLIYIHKDYILKEELELSLYVQLANESYLNALPHVKQIYLNSDKIIEVAKQAKVDAIHPGYGFLSESSEFAKRCYDENITFIGPTPESIEKMEDKVFERRHMVKSNDPIIPSSNGDVKTVDNKKMIDNK